MLGQGLGGLPGRRLQGVVGSGCGHTQESLGTCCSSGVSNWGQSWRHRWKGRARDFGDQRAAQRG